MAFKLKMLTPTEAIQRLSDNDPSFTKCNLTKSAVLQMPSGSELIMKLAAALATNTHCLELIMEDCNIGDKEAAAIAEALKTNNTLVHLDVQNNRIKDEGGTALANAIAVNQMLIQLNILNQKNQPKTAFGDATLHAIGDMFDTNITLLKIIWRLESRQSFTLNKKMVRNNDIDRRIKAGKEYGDIMPEKAKPIPPAVIAKRNEAATFLGLGTPRGGDSAPVGEGTTPRARSESLPISARFGAAAPPPARPVAPPLPAAPALPPAPAIMAPELESKFKALELEYLEAAAALKATFEAKQQALLEPPSEAAAPPPEAPSEAPALE